MPWHSLAAVLLHETEQNDLDLHFIIERESPRSPHRVPYDIRDTPLDGNGDVIGSRRVETEKGLYEQSETIRAVASLGSWRGTVLRGDRPGRSEPNIAVLSGPDTAAVSGIEPRGNDRRPPAHGEN